MGWGVLCPVEVLACQSAVCNLLLLAGLVPCSGVSMGWLLPLVTEASLVHGAPRTVTGRGPRGRKIVISNLKRPRPKKVTGTPDGCVTSMAPWPSVSPLRERAPQTALTWSLIEFAGYDPVASDCVVSTNAHVVDWRWRLVDV